MKCDGVWWERAKGARVTTSIYFRLMCTLGCLRAPHHPIIFIGHRFRISLRGIPQSLTASSCSLHPVIEPILLHPCSYSEFSQCVPMKASALMSFLPKAGHTAWKWTGVGVSEVDGQFARRPLGAAPGPGLHGTRRVPQSGSKRLGGSTECAGRVAVNGMRCRWLL